MANINTLRALTVAANSLRYNPEIDPDDAYMYEMAVINVRDSLAALSEGGGEE